jgi:hypothetical protein
MPIPTGTEYYIPVICNHALIAENAPFFLYQIDLSSKLSGDPTFKSFISDSSNIAIYDFTVDVECTRVVFLDLSNDKLLIYFCAAADVDADKMFYVCVGNAINRENEGITFTNPGYVHFWPVNEFVDGPIMHDSAGSTDGAVISPATIGNTAKFGNGLKLTSPGYVNIGDVSMFNSTQSFFIEFIYYHKPTADYEPILKLSGVGWNGIKIKKSTTTFEIHIYNNAYTVGYKSTSGWSEEYKHVVILFDGTQSGNSNRLKLYINGQLQSLSFVGTIPALTANLSGINMTINRLTGSTYPYVGIDEFGCGVQPASSAFVTSRYNMLFYASSSWTVEDGEYYSTTKTAFQIDCGNLHIIAETAKLTDIDETMNKIRIDFPAGLKLLQKQI